MSHHTSAEFDLTSIRGGEGGRGGGPATTAGAWDLAQDVGLFTVIGQNKSTGFQGNMRCLG